MPLLALLLAFTPCLTCLTFAGLILLVHGPQASGWGWFLLLGLFVLPSVPAKLGD